MLSIPGLYDSQENILSVIKELSVPCHDCRLGYLHDLDHNKGLIWRGNTNAKIALVSIMPGPDEMKSGKPLTGKSGQLSDRWFEYIGLDTNKDMFVINVVQCKPPNVLKKGEDKASQREPETDELATCFPTRCLRVIRTMPNLEVVITMGWVAAKCILGGDPKEASHMGHWYVTSLLPNKAIYCLPHPAAILREKKSSSASALIKRYKVIKCLDRFRRSYLESSKALKLAKGIKLC
jgi:uracil-DNA glycosylase family 4